MVSDGNLDKVFKGQQRDEEFILFFRQHWIVLVSEFFYLILLFVVITAIVYTIGLEGFSEMLVENAGMKVLALMILAVVTFMVHRFFNKLFNHFMTVGIITNKRLLRHNHTVFFSDVLDAVDLSQIQNVERSEKGVFPNILHYGTIKVYLSAAFTEMIFTAVRNDKFIFRSIGRAIAERNRVLEEEGVKKGHGKGNQIAEPGNVSKANDE